MNTETQRNVLLVLLLVGLFMVLYNEIPLKTTLTNSLISAMDTPMSKVDFKSVLSSFRKIEDEPTVAHSLQQEKGYKNDSIVYSGTKCQRKINIAFIGSNVNPSINNLCYRFGLEHNLNVVLKNPLLDPSAYNTTSIENVLLPIPGNESYNVVCPNVLPIHDIRRLVMPRNAVFIGIIRDPITHFMSELLYFYETKYKSRKNTSEILQDYLKRRTRKSDTSDVYVRNKMFLEFGLPRESFEKDEAINHFIDSLDAVFHVFIINENLLESLVYMKRLLRWSQRDIFLLSSATTQNDNFQPKESDMYYLRALNYADVKLYRYFKNKMLTEIEKAGSDFKLEVAHCKHVLQEFQKFCNNKSAETILFNKSKWNEAFVMTSEDCKTINNSKVLIEKLSNKTAEKYSIWKENTLKLSESYQFKMHYQHHIKKVKTRQGKATSAVITAKSVDVQSIYKPGVEKINNGELTAEKDASSMVISEELLKVHIKHDSQQKPIALTQNIQKSGAGLSLQEKLKYAKSPQFSKQNNEQSRNKAGISVSNGRENKADQLENLNRKNIPKLVVSMEKTMNMPIKAVSIKSERTTAAKTKNITVKPTIREYVQMSEHAQSNTQGKVNVDDDPQQDDTVDENERVEEYNIDDQQRGSLLKQIDANDAIQIEESKTNEQPIIQKQSKRKTSDKIEVQPLLE